MFKYNQFVLLFKCYCVCCRNHRWLWRKNPNSHKQKALISMHNQNVSILHQFSFHNSHVATCSSHYSHKLFHIFFKCSIEYSPLTKAKHNIKKEQKPMNLNKNCVYCRGDWSAVVWIFELVSIQNVLWTAYTFKKKLSQVHNQHYSTRLMIKVFNAYSVFV